MDSEVVHHHQASAFRATLLELDQEMLEGDLVIAALKSLHMDDSSFIAYAAYHGYRGAPLVRQRDLHAFLEPDSGRGLPQMEGGLVDVDYLEVRVPHHPLGHQETVLILLLPKLRLAVLLPLVDDLWLDEPDAQSPIVVVQS